MRKNFWVEFAARKLHKLCRSGFNSRWESFFRTKDTEDDKCITKNAFSIWNSCSIFQLGNSCACLGDTLVSLENLAYSEFLSKFEIIKQWGNTQNENLIPTDPAAWICDGNILKHDMINIVTWNVKHQVLSKVYKTAISVRKGWWAVGDDKKDDRGRGFFPIFFFYFLK